MSITTIPLDEVKQHFGLPSITKKSKTSIVIGGADSTSSAAASETVRFDLHDLIHAEKAVIDSKDNRPYFHLDRETANDFGVRSINSNAASWAECMVPTKSLSSSSTYFDACRSVKCYRLPCPAAQNVSLSGGTGKVVTIDFVSDASVRLPDLYGANGDGLTINVPWDALRRHFKGVSKDGKTCIRHLSDAVLVGYDAARLPEDFRLTLHNGEREMSSALLGRSDRYVHTWEAKEKPRGLLIYARSDTFRPDRRGADLSAGQSLLTSNKDHFAWHHRLIGMDYKSTYEQIRLLPAADNYPVELGLVTVNIGTLKSNPQHNRDFLVWMTAHFWTALFHLTVLHIKDVNKGRSEKLPVSIPDADSGAVVVSREALLMVLDVLYSMSGQRSVVNLCDGLQVRLNVCGGKTKAVDLLKMCQQTAEDDSIPEVLYAKCLEGKMNLRFRIQFTFHEIVQLNPYASSFNLLLANDAYKQYQGRRQVTKDALKASHVSLGGDKNGYLMAGSFMA